MTSDSINDYLILVTLCASPVGPGSHEGFRHIGVARLHQLVHWSGKVDSLDRLNPTGNVDLHTFKEVNYGQISRDM
jgi:hypothetical protein